MELRQDQLDCYHSEGTRCAEQWDQYQHNKLMPIYCVPIHWIISLIVAIPLHKFIEKPLRQLLKPTN